MVEKRILINDLMRFRGGGGISRYVDGLVANFSQHKSHFKIIPHSETILGYPISRMVQFYDSRQKKNGIVSLNRAHLPNFSFIKKHGHDFFSGFMKWTSGFNKWDLYHEPDAIPLPIHAPTVTTIHDLSVLMFPEWHPTYRVKKYEKHIKRSLKQSICFLANSNQTKSDLMNFLGVAESKIKVIHHAPDTAFFPAPQREVALTLQRLKLPRNYILFVSTIEPRKNVAKLLEAYKLLSHSARKRFPLALVGRYGWGSEDVLEMLGKSPWSHEVIWLQNLSKSDLRAVMSGAKLLVYPSLYEGFGLPPLEAMLCHTPVIISDRGSLREIVGEAGMKINPMDVLSIKNAIESLIEDEKLQTFYKTQGELQVKKFTWEKTASKTLKIYESILGVSSTSRSIQS